MKTIKLYLLFLTILFLIHGRVFGAPYKDSLGDVYEFDSNTKFTTTSFLILEFLMALDHPPIGASDVSGYEDRVSDPEKLPKSIVDLGQSIYKPNLELLKSLNPDLFIVEKNYSYKDIELYKKMIPTVVVDFFGFRKGYIQNIFNEFKKFARSLNKQEKAVEVEERYKKSLESSKKVFKENNIKKSLFIQIWTDSNDNLSIRIHANDYFFAELMKNANLQVINNPKNIEKPSRWGFHTYSVKDFNKVDLTNCTLFIGISDEKKIMPMIKKNLILSAIFKNHKINPYIMAPAWPWGGPLSAIKFLDNMKKSVTNNNRLFPLNH